MARYQLPIVNFVYRMIGDAGDAEDVAQGVFVRAYQTIRKPSFKQGSGQVSTWLFQIARNAAIDWLRRRKRRPSESLDAMTNGGEYLVSPGRTADEAVMGAETGAKVAEAIAGLPENQREILVLREYHDMSYAEIADVVKTSVKSVETRLYRAKQTLRVQLAHLFQAQ